MVALLCLLLVTSEGERPLPQDPLPKVADYVGMITIWGNVVTNDNDILKALSVFPGQRLNRGQIRMAEWRLLWAFSDRFAWWLGERPHIRLVPPEDYEEFRRYYEVRIEFFEVKPQ